MLTLLFSIVTNLSSASMVIIIIGYLLENYWIVILSSQTLVSTQGVFHIKLFDCRADIENINGYSFLGGNTILSDEIGPISR